MNQTCNIAIFASGSGSNAEALISYFRRTQSANIALVVTNVKNAGVLDRADSHQVPTYVHTKEELENGQLLEVLNKYNIDFIALGGYLKKIPAYLIEAFPNKIVNIHPSLLPKYGGPGMYGIKVHEAVLEAGEIESGLTIHYVNENYDEGDIIAQFNCPVLKNDSPKDLQVRVLKLEHTHYPQVVEKLIKEIS